MKTWVTNILFFVEVFLFVLSGIVSWVNLILAPFIFSAGILVALYVGKRIKDEVQKHDEK